MYNPNHHKQLSVAANKGKYSCAVTSSTVSSALTKLNSKWRLATRAVRMTRVAAKHRHVTHFILELQIVNFTIWRFPQRETFLDC